MPPYQVLVTVAIFIQLLTRQGAAQSCAASGQQCGNSQTGPRCCSPGNYCQPWNPSYYQCRATPAQCGAPQVGVDFNGNDLAQFAGMKLPDECCSKCAVTSGCAAFTFVNFGWDGQTHCYLKTGTGTKKRLAGAISAVVSTCGTSNGDSCGNAKQTSCCPNQTYCQPWNAEYYQCKDIPAKCSTQLTDVDFYGNDMGVFFGQYPWGCCAQCAATPGCKGYTFVNTDPRGPACYLKSSTAGARSSVGAVSGIVNTPMLVQNTSNHVQAKIRSGVVQAKSVNLGGWLMTEGWMSFGSALYNNVSWDTALKGEYTVMKTLVGLKGRSAAVEAFEKHRQSWITEADIKEIATTGVLNSVRVPVGHWIVRDAISAPGSEGDMYAPGALKYLDKLINEWAVKYNIAVIISLHAHQGSQNGWASTSPPVFGEAGWSTSQTNYDNSITFATFLADRYKGSPAFLGLGLLNEPAYPTDRSRVLAFYVDAYDRIRAAGNACILSVSPMQGENTPDGYAGIISGPQYENVWNEIHPYFIWGFGGKSEQWILDYLDTYSATNLQRQPTANRLYVGEWCMGSPPDEYAVFQNVDNFRELGRKQLAMYNQFATGGWAFWSWQHSDDATKRTGWSMRKVLRDGDLKLS